MGTHDLRATGTTTVGFPGWGLPPELLDAAFPFHLVLDGDLRILQAGTSVQMLCPGLVGQRLEEVLELTSPKIPVTSTAFRARSRSMFLLRAPRGVTLRGQVLSFEDADVLVFVGSPWVTETASLRSAGLTLNDFAVSDAVIDYLLMLQQQAAALAQAQELAAALQLSEARTRRILETANDAFIEVSAGGVVTAWNPRAEQIFGWTATEAVGRSFAELVVPTRDLSQHQRRITAAWAEAEEAPVRVVDARALHKDGRSVPVEVAMWATWHQGQQTMNISARDITERKEAERRAAEQAKTLAYQSLHDPLTGLANRALLRDRLAHALSLSGNAVSVVLLDLDDFKAVNDVSGHAAGDSMLVEVARRLQRCVRGGDTVARLGGDEFAVVIEQGDADQLSQRILRELSAPLDIAGRQVVPQASIGIVAADGHVGIEELLLRADVAMYAAKAGGKGRVEHFTTEMTVAIRLRADLFDALRQAVPRGEIVVHYQPIIDGRTGSATRVEALARWQRPDGLLLPGHFLRLAEETGLIIDIGHEVLRQTCAQLSSWLAEDAGRTVAVNVSAVQLAEADLAARVLGVLEESGVDPGQLILEVTETLFLDTTPELIACLTTLRNQGISVSIDDFGTGYSSLHRLQALPIDSIKIDRSFVNLIRTGQEDLPILTSMIRMAQALGLDVTAEGVETAAQAERLDALDCDHLQGYLFARPHPAPDAVTTVAASAEAAWRRNRSGRPS